PRSRLLPAEDLLDHGLTVSDDLPEALGPFDRLVLRLHLDQGETAGQLLGLGERPVGHGHRSFGAPDPRARWGEPTGRQQDAGSLGLFGELSHLIDHLRARWCARLAIDGVEQESHLRVSFDFFEPGPGILSMQPNPRSTGTSNKGWLNSTSLDAFSPDRVDGAKER